ncbi:MAG: STAS domain-containing protein [Ilumatobacter sp.]|uniref:STAS domain-containing protein n=1 Tax=Ilumatobacter sp. TaxID=1967498 RepID=UPI00329A40A2
MSGRSTHHLSIEVERGRNAARLVVDGDLDRSSTGELRDIGIGLVDACEHVSVDVVAASVIDSAALGVLIELHRAARAAGCRFDVTIGPAHQRTLFATTGLDDYIDLIQAP